MGDSGPNLAALLAELRELPEAGLLDKLREIANEEARLATLRSLVEAHLARRQGEVVHTPGSRLLTAKDVHEILGVPVAYVYELMRRGVLACTAIGKYRRVDPRDLDAFLSKNRLQARDDAEYSPRGARRTRDGREQRIGRPGQQQGPRHTGSRSRSRGAAQPTPSGEGVGRGADGD